MANIPYAKQSINAQDIAAVTRALKDDYLTQGPMVERFEKAVAEHCGAKYAVAVNSGTSALHLACLASGVKTGDEGITSPITFVASANCLLYCGAKPVFADIDEQTVCLDPDQVVKKLTKKTKVLIPVHFAGQPCDMARIHKIGEKHKLIVIEDACHALGATYQGSQIGACKYSDMTVLSFHTVKLITTGEGGMVLTNNKDLYENLIMYRSHGITRDPSQLMANPGGWYYEMQALGFNYRITDFQCTLGLSQLQKLESFLKRRRVIVNSYDRAFLNNDLFIPLLEKPNCRSAHHLYVLRFELDRLGVDRRNVFDAYRHNGIFVNVHYIPVYYHPFYRKLGYKKGLCPKAEAYYESAITLPLYPGLSAREVKKVVEVSNSIVRIRGGRK